MWRGLGLGIALFFAQAAAATEIVDADYDSVRAALDGLADFETPATRGNYFFSHVAPFACADFGERFQGQAKRLVLVRPNMHEILGKEVAVPLRVIHSNDQTNLVLQWSRKDQTTRLLGLAPDRKAGEGAIAVQFHSPQSQFGFTYRGEIEFRASGSLQIHIYDEDGNLLAKRRKPVHRHGAYAFKTSDGRPIIAGVSLSNFDPEGVSYDDFVMSCQTLPMS